MSFAHGVGPRQLRALAHPLRASIVALLRRDGPGTSSSLGSTLGISSGLASYHLRELAESGLIAEVPERGTARERWWRAAHEATTIDTGSVPDDARTALDVLERMWDRRRTEIERRWEERHEDRPRGWRDARGRSDWLFRLTPEEAVEMEQAVAAALEPYQRLSIERRDSDVQSPDDAGLVAAFLSTVPVDPDAPIGLEGTDPAPRGR